MALLHNYKTQFENFCKVKWAVKLSQKHGKSSWKNAIIKHYPCLSVGSADTKFIIYNLYRTDSNSPVQENLS